jgi:2-polyprenyl-3-methyl-5-hydroxy-6-metoxy-1,4-benzoquinol methylase
MLEWLRKALPGARRRKWDKEYASGRWDYFREALEASRYEAVLDFIRRYFKGGRILEVGCGEGILQERMPWGIYSHFLGIDISKVAIRKAASRLKDEVTDYQVGDMEKFIPGTRPDLIVFSEVLNYSEDPFRLFKRYADFLAPGGLIIISLTETPRALGIMKDIEQQFPSIDQKVSVNERGTWHCRVYPVAGGQSSLQRP